MNGSVTFAALLREQLAARRMTQWRLAQEMQSLGYQHDHSIVCRWCSGQRTPSYASCRAIADALGLADHDRALLFATARYWPDRWALPERGNS